jgi:hypothetical protein
MRVNFECVYDQLCCFTRCISVLCHSSTFLFYFVSQKCVDVLCHEREYMCCVDYSSSLLGCFKVECPCAECIAISYSIFYRVSFSETRHRAKRAPAFMCMSVLFIYQRLLTLLP